MTEDKDIIALTRTVRSIKRRAMEQAATIAENMDYEIVHASTSEYLNDEEMAQIRAYRRVARAIRRAARELP
jgi:hypothetical protein